MTVDEGSQFHFGRESMLSEEGSLCWPSTALGNYYFSSPAVMRACLGFDTVAATQPQPIKLHEIYESTDDARLFLADNSFLVELLNEAVPHLESHFGDTVKVQLEVFSDPDNGSERELFARVPTKLPARKAVELLDRFDTDWWFDASSRAQCLVSFALRYV